MLYSRGIAQYKIYHDSSLALLLFIVALESLITEGLQGKRRGLAKIVPKLITIDGLPSSDLEKIIDGLYKDRSNFVHAGRTPVCSYEKNKVELLNRITALILLKYFELDRLLSLSSSKSRAEAWTQYLKNIFHSSCI